jgi:hypothetical protein
MKAIVEKVGDAAMLDGPTDLRSARSHPNNINSYFPTMCTCFASMLNNLPNDLITCSN